MLELTFMAKMIRGVQGELSDNGYHLLISNTTDPVTLPDIVRDEKVEGLLIHGDLQFELCEQLSARLPIVAMGQNNVSLPLPTVNVNNKGAIISAAKYLFELGHRRIAFVTIEPAHKDAGERLLGYREALELLGLPRDPALEAVGKATLDPSPRQPQKEPPAMDEFVEPLLRLASPPTALIVSGDWHCIGIYRVLQARGIRIPQDISIIGFDNEQQVCVSLSPTLTSLDYPSDEIGRQAVQLLLRQLKHKELGQDTILIKSTLVKRNSCGPARL